ncbi:MAG: response regulator [Acidobacteriota bacterium]
MRKKILIVDFNLYSLRELKQFLESNEFIVYSAQDGEMAYKTYLEDKPDLVITEIVIPKIHGLHLCKRIALESEHRTPVILISGIYKSIYIKEEVINFYGASAFFEKPINKRLLMWEILKLLNIRISEKILFKKIGESELIEMYDESIDYKKIADSAREKISSKEFFHDIIDEINKELETL